MGLNQGDVDHRETSKFQAWLVPGALALIALAIAASGDFGRELLRYDRDAIAGGQLWRLLSGHLAHLGWSHFVLNAAGLLLVFFILGQRFTPLTWLLAILIIVLGIDLAFWILEPQLVWYVGLSGLLHGCLAAGVIGGLRQPRLEERVLLAGLILKLVYEQTAGPLPGSEGTAGGNVLVDAHLYGAIAGALVGAWLCFRKAPEAAI